MAVYQEGLEKELKTVRKDTVETSEIILGLKKDLVCYLTICLLLID